MSAIRTETYEGALIPFQTGDAFVNATAMCAAFGKRPGDFLAIGTSKDFLSALAEELQVLPSTLVTLKRGNFSDGQAQGTWLHPDLALECARWLSPKFAIWCNRVIRRILSGEVVFGKKADSVPPMPDLSNFFSLMEEMKQKGCGADMAAQVASQLLRSRLTNPRPKRVTEPKGEPRPIGRPRAEGKEEAMLAIIRQGETTCLEIVRQFCSETGLGKSLAYYVLDDLLRAGKITRTPQGKTYPYRIGVTIVAR